MCKCTPIIRTPFCGRGNCLPPASREPTESPFAESVLAHFERRDKAEQLETWERGLSRYSHRSDSSGYAGRIGLEVLAELRQAREQAEALEAAVLDIDAHATGLDEDEDGFTTGGYIVSVGALHRALGVVGHAARKCRPGALCPLCGQTEALGTRAG